MQFSKVKFYKQRKAAGKEGEGRGRGKGEGGRESGFGAPVFEGAGARDNFFSFVSESY